MKELNISLKVALANTFVMYFKTHTYHWNIEGPNFSQYHSYLGDLYDELFDAVDPIAEHIRVLGDYGPISIKDMLSASTIKEDVIKPETPRDMFKNLQKANSEVVAALNKVAILATKDGNQGLLNYVADRIDIHGKHDWMLKSFLK